MLETINACFQEGEYAQKHSAQPYFPSDPWQNACARRGEVYEHWRWKPKDPSCESVIEKLEQVHLCDITIAAQSPEHRILFVGDSISYQMYSSLAMLSSDAVRISEVDQRHRTGSTNVSLCGHKITLTYVRNDYLTTGACKYCLDFWQFIPQHDVIVFNRGAHVPDDDTTHAQMIGFVTNLASVIDNQLVIWRTTVPGHPDCENKSTPTTFETRVPFSTESAKNYKWNVMPKQNELMMEVLSNHSLKYHVLDAFSMAIDRQDRHHGRRADGKVDCLHYCLPGPPDMWSKALIVVLLAHANTSKETA